METEDYRIFIIDDDEAICRSISLLLISAGYEVETYANTAEFLKSEELSGDRLYLAGCFSKRKIGP